MAEVWMDDVDVVTDNGSRRTVDLVCRDTSELCRGPVADPGPHNRARCHVLNKAGRIIRHSENCRPDGPSVGAQRTTNNGKEKRHGQENR